MYEPDTTANVEYSLGTEPLIRVGIVLDCDEAKAVHIRLPENRYKARLLSICREADSASRSAPPASAPANAGGAPAQLLPESGSTLTIARAQDGLTVQVADQPELVAQVLRLSSVGDKSPESAGGVLVRDVVAGRGFHWQKRIDQVFTGTLEFHAGKQGVVLANELPLEDYLAGVITAEMGAACPLDLLKAQCVVARSWLLAMSEPKHSDEPFDRCNDDCCQRFQGVAELNPTVRAAVLTTRGQVLLTPTGEVLDANYAKSCGGISELPRHVWGTDKPGISAVVDAPADAGERRFFPVTTDNLDEFLDGEWLTATRCYCSPNVVPVDAIGRYLGRVDEVDDYFRWTVQYERRKLEELLIEKLPEARDLVMLRDLRVISRGVSGRASKLEIEWEDSAGQVVRACLDSEYRIREVLHRKFLYSSAFAIRAERDGGGQLKTTTLRGAGWGHGVGMCQIGALGMALSGIDFEAICRHYYPEARLATVYE